MGERMSERDDLARVFMRTVPDHHPDLCDCDPEADTPCEGAYEHADAALAWFAERVEALIDRYDDPGYGMQEDEWRFVRDLRALYATPTTESEER